MILWYSYGIVFERMLDMAIPESIKKYRPKGTEIQEHKGRYYVYKVKAVYDPITKKSKRKSEGCIGQIIDGIGFVSNEKKSSNNTVKEYGATALLTSQSNDIKEQLIKIFGIDGLRIYTLAILKLLTNSNQKNMSVAYERSYISEMIPDIHISKNTLSDYMEKLGLQRLKMLEFLNEIPRNKNGSIIFDGSSFCSNSKNNPYVDYGYNPNNPKAKQVRLIYGFDTESNTPIYFNVIPGNITDKMAFISALKESNLSDCTLILDNGFYSKDNLEAMTNEDIDFIMPLSPNLNVVKQFDLKTFESIHFHFYYHKRTINYLWLETNYLEKYNVYVYYDLDRRRELLNNYYIRQNIKTEELDSKALKQLDNDTKYFGYTFLISSQSLGAENTYRQYKKRWSIEELFDTHKNTLMFDMSYEIKPISQLGWAFIEFISLLIYLRVESVLSSHKETKSLSVHDALLRYSAVVKCKNGNIWETWNLKSETKKQLELFSVTFL